jgi:hypothetical protein
MKQVLALGIVAAALAVGAVGAAGGTNPNTLTFAVYGDSPYLDPAFSSQPAAEFNATPAFIGTINADPSIQAVVHVGDIHSGSEACTLAYDQAVFNLWTAFQKPVIYTPGDNEWSDCTKTKEFNGKDVFGHGPDFNGDPLIHLGIIRNTFFPNPGWTLGQNPMQVISQALAHDPQYPTDAQYVENVMWEQSKALFVTINVPGGSNNDTDTWNGPAKNQAAEDAERAARTAADVRWLDAAFKLAEADNAHSVVIIAQADMWDTTDAPSHQTNYEPIISAMASNAMTYAKPVLYFNGDSHIYRSDNPLQRNSTCVTETNPCTQDAWVQHPYYDVPNFHRIVVHGSTFPLEWLKLSIDPRAAWENASTPTSWGPFSWQRKTQAQITP